ncbi:molecular chaperone HtpG [Alphaproteobacteria bacterium]|jgi:molecular chaperone HtpG|nr:molecular chaperone HtpG [Alphaproteobacteria bacterium]
MAKASNTKKPEKLSFQAEVSRLLHIVAHSLYSEREIFLRELISNASDACDRLRYEALTKPKLTQGDPDFCINISADKDAGTLTIADNGIGMNRKELIENLGTIARSGTAAMIDKLKGDSKEDINLIGQFGVGFYSSFMVADKVTVTTRKAGAAGAFIWESDGLGEFTLSEGERPGRGTTVTLTIKDDAKEFLEPDRIKHVVTTYSDHIPVAINLVDGENSERINDASALWTRPRNKIKADQYKEFYHHVAHATDDPWATLHFRVEGVIEYSGLLYIPTARPFNIFHPDRKNQVKLYVKRVFITEECDELLPSWLRFLRGVVDSEDLDLNVSREMLQNNPIVAKIKNGLVTRVLNELKKKAEKEPDSYEAFWEAFGPLIKEGIYESFENRDDLLTLLRCQSTIDKGLVSLEEYLGRMKKGQDAIYYITGENAEALKQSPQLEGFRARGVEVLLLSDPIDDFWLQSVGQYKEKPFKSVTQGGADLSDIKAPKVKKKDDKKSASDDTKATVDMGNLIALLKLTLDKKVADVRASERLTESAVCLVADETGLDMNLERLLKQHNQLDQVTTRILEINPDHSLIQSLAASAKKKGAQGKLEDAALLLLDQAQILEGEPVSDPVAFSRRMEAVMAKGFK